MKFLWQKLYTKIAVLLLVVFLSISSFSAYHMLTSAQVYQQNVTQKMHRDLAAHVIESYPILQRGGVLSDATLNKVEIEDIFHDLMILGPNFEFYLLDAAGNILAYSAKPDVVKRDRVATAPIQSFLADEALESPIYSDNPRSETRQTKIFSAAPIQNSGATVGYLYVILGSDIYDTVASALRDNRILGWGLAIFLLGLLFSFLATALLTGIIVRPLRRLVNQIQTVGSHGFDKNARQNSQHSHQLQEWSASSNNEIHILGSSFRSLLDKLEEQYAHAVTLDELRKELLAHISHDLRTPLSSLLGYLETWQMNSNRVGLDESKHYIDIAHRNALTLSRLVEQLFELANLDSANVQINLERFSIADLVQDVLQKFSIVAAEKKIDLQVSPQDTGIQVVGDIEKLERVFTNLIENALRHSRDRGSITVRLSERGGLVGVEVSDTGIGIPAEDLPHIFDAHYKACNSVRGNTRHGGIGLAITKRILELHRSTIKVESRVDYGTTFSFSLSCP